MEYKPNPRLCKKAARIWTANMVQPRFDQLGGRRGHDQESQQREAVMQSMITSICKNTEPWQLELFEIQLYMMLMSDRPFDLVPDDVIPEKYLVESKDDHGRITPPIKDQPMWHRPVHRFGTDYHPDLLLFFAGRTVGLPEQQHPIKSRVAMAWDSSHISYSFGYAAPSTYLYPYPSSADTDEDPEYWSKRWLRTSLCGDAKDIDQMMILAANHRTEWIEVDGDEEFHVPKEITDAATAAKVDEVMAFMGELREKRQGQSTELSGQKNG